LIIGSRFLTRFSSASSRARSATLTRNDNRLARTAWTVMTARQTARPVGLNHLGDPIMSISRKHGLRGGPVPAQHPWASRRRGRTRGGGVADGQRYRGGGIG